MCIDTQRKCYLKLLTHPSVSVYIIHIIRKQNIPNNKLLLSWVVVNLYLATMAQIIIHLFPDPW